MKSKLYKKVKDSFCVLPFSHLATHPDGGVTPCCESRHYAKGYNLNNQNFKDILNSRDFEEVRQSMLEGRKHPSCNFCYKREEQGLDSKRIQENKKYNFNENTLEYFTSRPLISAELRLGNICNAKCLICNPWSSSKWNEDASVVYHKKVEFKQEWYKDLKFYSTLIENSHDLIHIWFNGGEPTLIKEHISLLERLVYLKKSNSISLEYNINGTNLPNKLLKLWKKFKQVNLSVSIDDINERLYYSRFPIRHTNVIENLQILSKTDFNIIINPTVSLYNIFNIHNVYKFFKTNFNKEIVLNFVKRPLILTINNLPEECKLEVLNNVKSNNLPEQMYRDIEFNLYNGKNLGLTPFFNFTNKLDKHRNISILEYLPEYTRWHTSKQVI